MNKNYIKGRRKEYKVMHDFINKGYDFCGRTSGSHGIFDVYAINVKKKEIMLIQCKPDSMSDNAKRKLENQYKKLNNKFKVEFEVI